ncbi:MAG: cobalamin-binding protein, partial [Bacillota bacterium]
RFRRRGIVEWVGLGLTLVLILAGCGGGAGGGQGAQTPATPGADTVQGGEASTTTQYPLSVSDDAGRQVTIQKRPERIVSLAPSNTEILFAIGAGDRVVGVDSFSDYPAEASSLPKVGGVTDTNFEQIVALDPDLALAIGGAEEQVQRLEELGIPTVVIQPATLEDVLERIELIGRIVDAQEGAARVVRDMRNRIDAVRSRVADIPEEKRIRVFYEVWHDPLMTVGPGGFIHDVIEAAGGVNIAADAGSPWPEISLETVVDKDPQVIIVPASLKSSYEELRAGKRKGWEGITAVREGRIYSIDDNIISRPGPRLVEGLEQIARWLYPDRFQ